MRGIGPDVGFGENRDDMFFADMLCDSLFEADALLRVGGDGDDPKHREEAADSLDRGGVRISDDVAFLSFGCEDLGCEGIDDLRVVAIDEIAAMEVADVLLANDAYVVADLAEEED